MVDGGEDDPPGVEGGTVPGVASAPELSYDGGRSDDEQMDRLEAIFRSLTSRRRRFVLYELERTDVTDIESLAKVVAATTRGESTEAVEPAAVESTQTALVHADLPLLESAGFVAYDPRSGSVRYEEGPPLLTTILQLCAEIEAPENGR